ncbi:MAG: dihydropyrimidinase [Anaerolineae bacterium]|nr:dihydropyrimidinase [Anaerolineae bacterium]
MEYELVIQGGTLVSRERVEKMDLAVQGGKIAAIAPRLSGKMTYSASGMLVIPGGVDPHVHIDMATPTTRTSDDWSSGTLAAAFGGTTTVIDFIEPEGGEPLMQAYEKRRAEADGLAMIDYSLHMTISRSDPDNLAQIPEVVEAGMTSFKLYTTYEGLALPDEGLIASFEAVRQAGGLVLVHCENDAIIQASIRRLSEAGKLHPSNYPDSRPPIAEIEAIRRVIALTRFIGVPLYVVHISTGTGASAVERARKHGQVVYGETCPQYLLLNEQVYRNPDGLEAVKYICAPPIRQQKDNKIIWELLKSGGIQTIGTDHCPFNVIGQKDSGKENFRKSLGCVPGIEPRLALMYTYGVRAGNITMEQWVSACCTAPAEIFGLAPQKGVLAVGSDADIVIFDPEKKVTLTKALLHERVDYTPYENMQLTGYPHAAFLRGRLLVEDGRLVNPQPDGRFLKRQRHQIPTARMTDEY